MPELVHLIEATVNGLASDGRTKQQPTVNSEWNKIRNTADAANHFVGAMVDRYHRDEDDPQLVVPSIPNFSKANLARGQQVFYIPTIL